MNYYSGGAVVRGSIIFRSQKDKARSGLSDKFCIRDKLVRSATEKRSCEGIISDLYSNRPKFRSAFQREKWNNLKFLSKIFDNVVRKSGSLGNFIKGYGRPKGVFYNS